MKKVAAGRLLDERSGPEGVKRQREEEEEAEEEAEEIFVNRACNENVPR